MEITPTPVIFVEDIRLNDLSINGVLFTELPDGTRVPEVGAFIYVYINNVLANEAADPTSRSYGTRTGSVTITDAGGAWVCRVSPLRAGQRLSAVAHATGKSISAPSEPYRVGSLPTPTNIHIVSKYGTTSRVQQGMVVVEGFFEGLHDRKYVGPTTEEWNGYTIPAGYVFPYTSNFDLHTYINGIKQSALPYNEVWSRNFLESIVDVDWTECFTISVQGVPVSVCLANVVYNIYNEIHTYSDLGADNTLQIYPPSDTGKATIIHLYKNGRRLVEGSRYDYVLQFVGKATNVIFTAGFVPDVTDIYQVDYLVIRSEDLPYYTTQVVTSSTSAVHGIVSGAGLQVFKNGLRLKFGSDFYIDTQPSGTYVVLSENLAMQDTLVLAYFTLGESAVPFRIVTTDDFIATVHVNAEGATVKRSTLRLFKGGMTGVPQLVSVYKNGVKLAMRSGYDISKIASAADTYIDFELSEDNPWSFTGVVDAEGNTSYVVTDNIVVELMYSDVSASKTASALNSLPDFVENKIVARVEPSTDDSGKSFLVLSSPYTLEFLQNDVSYYSTFGKNPSYVPGKDENGNFKNFIDFKGNRWRYTFASPLRRLATVSAATFYRAG